MINVGIENCSIPLELRSLFFSKKKVKDISDYIKKNRYDPSDASQQKLIETSITLFNIKYKKLLSLDQKLGIGVCANSFLWLCGLINLPLTVLGLATIFLYGAHYENRQILQKAFQSQLQELIDIYQWCLHDKGLEITHDKFFLKILEKIAPFVSTENLCVWPTKIYSDISFSDEFCKILSDSPHHLHIHIQAKPSKSKLFKHIFKTKKSQTPSDEQDQIVSLNHSSTFFNQSISETKLYWYGYQGSDDLKELRILGPQKK